MHCFHMRCCICALLMDCCISYVKRCFLGSRHDAWKIRDAGLLALVCLGRVPLSKKSCPGIQKQTHWHLAVSFLDVVEEVDTRLNVCDGFLVVCR